MPLLMGTANYTNPSLSPDGKYLAYVGPSKGSSVYNVFIKQLPPASRFASLAGKHQGLFETEGTAGDKQVTFDKKRGVTSYFWLWDGSGIIYQQDADGDEKYHLYLVPLQSLMAGQRPKVKDLTSFKGVRVDEVFRDKDHPRQVYVTMNKDNPARFDLHRIDLDSGKVERMLVNPDPIIYWYFDSNFTLKGVLSYNNSDGSKYMLVRDKPGNYNTSSWRRLFTWSFGDDGQVLGFNKAGDQLFVASSVGRDTTEVQAISIQPGATVLRRIASNPYADMDDVIFDSDTWEPQMVAFNYHKSQWTIIDPALKALGTRLEEFKPGFEVELAGRSKDRQTLLLRYSNSNSSPSWYLYRQGKWPPVLLLEDRPELRPYSLAASRPVVITARDGLQLPAYLTLPILPAVPKDLPACIAGPVPDLRGAGTGAGKPPAQITTERSSSSSSSSSSSGKPSCKPLQLQLPMVLLVHGGPWARDYWDTNSQVQMASNRGYAVLQVNFRGSTGFGKRFLNLGNGQWGVGTMQQDLTDAVQWAIKNGIADPKRICIAGGSYGGYAALAGLTFTPNLYKCGIDMYGISNVATTMKAMPPYWGVIRFRFYKRIGDPVSNATYNQQISPLFHVDKIRSPLMIGQGANDPRVIKREADQIYKAVKQRHPNMDVEYVLYPDEGHGWMRPDNKLDWALRMERFYARHLGGRVGPDIQVRGSSAQLITKV
ncbi:hypothetical protein OEZ85_012870 [Tetradesmus obliquus]|uniref:Peptidase S9 prolyl oligopeptidase catalytic domain-containing protein n=1 Tax=Tetradesmus obliquus TaxID=3088 RepID=A0ABY8U468_TETOB|nr:hypothetical protein OEZ85_012870 [Tetradesmus obliquus]